MVFRKKLKNKHFRINISKLKIYRKFFSYIYNIYFNNKFDWDGKSILILHLSDTHFQNLKKFRKYESLESYLKEKSFDFIVHTGDIVEGDIGIFSNKEMDFLKNLNPKISKLFVNGNHEYYKNANLKIEKVMNKLDFNSLNNKFLINDEIKVVFIGLDVYDKNYSNFILNFDIKKLKKNYDKYLFILLVHDLDKVEKKFLENFDLVLSGHTHAGEINLIFYDGMSIAKLKGKFHDRYKQRKSIKILFGKIISIISPGMYSHTQKIYKIPRFLTQKEGIVEVYIKKENEKI